MLILTGCVVFFYWITAVAGLWPLPRYFEHGSSTVWLSPDVQLFIVNENVGFPDYGWAWSRIQWIMPYFRSSDKDDLAASNVEVLQDAFNRTKAAIFSHRFVPRKFHPRKAAFEPEISDLKPKLQSVTIEMTSPTKFSKGNTSFILEESYSLEISANGSALILTGSVIGGLHALETFAQLFYAHSQSKVESYTSYAPVSIMDGPAFKHRGLNLDISRNCIPPSDVMRVLEAMACNKMNRLHIHASDAQSWPLEVPTLPNLALEGAYEPSQIWTTEDLRHVQRYGQLRGIEVYLEIDIPGHTTAIAMSQPELVTAANREPWPVYAEEPPSGQLRLNSTEVFTFLTSLLGDVLPRNAQFSHIFHFGGDELNLNAYGLDPSVNSTSKDVLRPLLQLFMNHVFDMAMKHSLTPILWEEMLLDWDLSVPDSTIIQTWRSNEALSKVLSRGHQVLFGSSTHFYLDCGHGAFLDPTNPQEPNDDPRVRPPYLDHCGPYKNWRHVYSYNPLAGIPDDQLHLILGGEVHMWGEMTDAVTLDGMLWPRTAAAAEVLWRGPGTPVSEHTTRRLAEMRERLLLRGVAAGMVQMEWCLRNLGGCTL